MWSLELLLKCVSFIADKEKVPRDYISTAGLSCFQKLLFNLIWNSLCVHLHKPWDGNTLVFPLT